MRIAVLSGKGGTGKTTIAASLFRVMPDCRYVDCDVEEPNGALFLHPQLTQEKLVEVKVPQIDATRCTLCGKCAEICQFHALAVLPTRVMTFNELCHSCGACSLVCESDAITEVPRRMGLIESTADQTFYQGRLDIGEPMGIPIITELKAIAPTTRHEIYDSSPGASCAVVKTLDHCDFALLVTEPTPFGLHDLKIAVELVDQLKIPAGVVLNKAGLHNGETLDYLKLVNIPVLLEIPFSRTIAEGYSRGILPVDAAKEWRDRFAELAEQIVSQYGPQTPIQSFRGGAEA